MFNTLDASAGARKRRAASFSGALFFQVLLIASIVFLGILFPGELPVPERRYALTWVQAMQPPEKPAIQLPRTVPHFVAPKLSQPARLELPPPPEVKPLIPKVQPTIAAVHPPAPPPAPAPPTPFERPIPAPKPKEQPTVRTGLFGGAAEPVTTKRPLHEVQTGGFGSPEGLPGRAQGANPGNVPKLGSFGLPEGPGIGNGTGGHRGVQGVVASAGFGSGIAGPATGSATGSPKVAMGGFGPGAGDSHAGGGSDPKVSMGGFATVKAEPPTTKSIPGPAPVQFQSVEILFKPAPAYTAEARELKIQGDVGVSVVFQANGTVKVIGVVKSLGHGLDKVAQQAAEQIRFKPAQRDGKPTDFPATVRIQFRLAG